MVSVYVIILAVIIGLTGGDETVGPWSFAALGVLLTGYSVYCWRGRSSQARSWARLGFLSDHLILGVFPGIGLLSLSFGIGGIFGTEGPVGTFAALIFIVSMGFTLMGILVPKWWGPGWYRKREALKAGEGMGGALSTAFDAFTTEPEVLSSDQVEGVFAGKPMDRWRGGWVHDPDSDRRAHSVGRKGAVFGNLVLHEQGLTFAATKQEDALRGEPTTLTIPAEKIIKITVVPARAGADGVPRKGWLYRSFWKRLLIGTADTEYVFEIAFNRAAQAAEAISAGTGRP